VGSDRSEVSCDEPHSHEVYGRFDLAGDSYPGEDAIIDQARDGCLERFEAYVGEVYDTSEWNSGAVYPTEFGWEVDRSVICHIYRTDNAPSTGTAQA